MYTREVVFSNRTSLAGRQATNLVQIANKYQSAIWLECKERRVNGKSLLGILALGITIGDNVKIVTSGKDEVAAINAIAAYFEGKLNE